MCVCVSVYVWVCVLLLGDWLLGARCFPIKPVTGVCRPPSMKNTETERVEEGWCRLLGQTVIMIQWCLDGVAHSMQADITSPLLILNMDIWLSVCVCVCFGHISVQHWTSLDIMTPVRTKHSYSIIFKGVWVYQNVRLPCRWNHHVFSEVLVLSSHVSHVSSLVLSAWFCQCTKPWFYSELLPDLPSCGFESTRMVQTNLKFCLCRLK